MRHDGIGVAAIRIVMLEDVGDDPEVTGKVHEEHTQHRVATELVQRMDARRLGTHVRLSPGCLTLD